MVCDGLGIYFCHDTGHMCCRSLDFSPQQGPTDEILNQAGDVVTKLVNEESDFLLDELPHTGSVSMLVCMVCGGTSLMVGLLLCSGKKKRI